MLKLKLEVCFEDEQIEELFDSYDVKFSKAKMLKLKKLLIEYLDENPDVLEGFIEEQMSEIIQDEWEK